MDTEKIIFIVLALVFTVISMLIKSKKQKPSAPQMEESDEEFQYEQGRYNDSNLDMIFQPLNVSNLQENYNFVSKTGKKKSKKIVSEKESFSKETLHKKLQNTDSEEEIGLLEDFEGTELQKAFLYSEIFNNTKN